MQFIDHPSFKEQETALESTLSKISIDSLNDILHPFDLCCIKFERLKHGGGVVNPLFILETKSILNENKSELILKISNTHRYWKHCRTTNEVSVMNYLREHTTIPISKIISYSCQSSTSGLGCEYILMEKVHGNRLDLVIEQMTNDALTRTVKEMVIFIKQLHNLTLCKNLIGSFLHDMSVAGLIQDGPPLGPFASVKELIINHLQWSIERIRADNNLLLPAKHLIPQLESVIMRVSKDDYLSTIKSFFMAHADLNPSNIFVDQTSGQILAVLDWEHSCMTFIETDNEFYTMWFNDNEQCEQMKLLVEQLGLTLSPNFISIQPLLDIMYPAVWLGFYSSSWFEKNEELVVTYVNENIKLVDEAINLLTI